MDLINQLPSPGQTVKKIGRDHMGRKKEEIGVLVTNDGYVIHDWWTVDLWEPFFGDAVDNNKPMSLLV